MRIPCQSIVSLCFSILWVFSVCFIQNNLWASHVPFRLKAVLAMGGLFTPYWSVQLVGFPTIHCREMLQRIQKSRKNKYAVLVLIKTQLAAALLNRKSSLCVQWDYTVSLPGMSCLTECLVQSIRPPTTSHVINCKVATACRKLEIMGYEPFAICALLSSFTQHNARMACVVAGKNS